jgi:hypothetical protein
LETIWLFAALYLAGAAITGRVAVWRFGTPTINNFEDFAIPVLLWPITWAVLAMFGVMCLLVPGLWAVLGGRRS